jgi:hypothetical protein
MAYGMGIQVKCTSGLAEIAGPMIDSWQHLEGAGRSEPWLGCNTRLCGQCLPSIATIVLPSTFF